MAPMDRMERFQKEAEGVFASSAARDNLVKLLDEGSFVELDAFAQGGVVTGYGAVEGTQVMVFAECAAPVNRQHSARIKKLYELAIKTGSPVIGLYDSNGGDLKEGNDALSAYGDLLLWTSNLSGVVPQIAVVTGVCAGSAALLAANADFVVMSEKGELFFTPPSVSKEEDAGTAKAAAAAGLCHLKAADAAGAIALARRLAALMPSNNLSAAPLFECADVGAAAELDAMCRDGVCPVKAVELCADAGSLLPLCSEYGAHAYTALGTIGGVVTGFAAASDLLCSCACEKLARFVSFCDAFSIPVVTLLNTQGFSPVSDSRAVRAYGKLAQTYAEATCPKVALVVGRAQGPAYAALAGKAASADLVLAWPSAEICPLDPVTAVSILYRDRITQEKSREELAEEYLAADASPYQAAADGLVDSIIRPADTRNVLISALDMLASKRENRLPKKHGVSSL